MTKLSTDDMKNRNFSAISLK